MKYKLLFLCFLMLLSLRVSSQTWELTGLVSDAENDVALPAATIQVLPSGQALQSDAQGRFRFTIKRESNVKLVVRYFGFETLEQEISFTSDRFIHVRLHPVHLSLSEVIVHGKHPTNEIHQTLPMQSVNRFFMLQNNNINFVKTLTNIAGVSSMDIGAGFSKPVIRGLGFNRVAVVDKNIVQQNQQWGADHGLEIDQYDVDNVNVYKGPMSLFHGSDAMGGVIEIKNPNIPDENGLKSELATVFKSNNNLAGTSLLLRYRHNNWFFRSTMSAQDYGDYSIPADSIHYLSWKMPIYNRKMKNTAGKECAASFSVNYKNSKVNTWMHFSDVYAKNGFFPGSHGIPDLKRLTLDGNSRNIDLPFSWSNHLKIINNTTLQLGKNALQLNLGFQQNFRQEISAFHTHYANQSKPKVNPDLELQFILNTLSGNAQYRIHSSEKMENMFGVSAERQSNRVAGYSFLLPDFERQTGGIYWIGNYKLNSDWEISGGLRYDVGRIHVTGYYDTLLQTYLEDLNLEKEEISRYAQRASDMNKIFSDFSGSLGVVFTPNIAHTLKINVGQSFRMPSANELAVNGLHHGAFRHEKGNPELKSEKGIQLDMDYMFKNRQFSFVFNPFFGYFDNFTFLNPTGEWSVLPHAGQIYAYQQAKAIIAGAETEMGYSLNDQWSFSSQADYVYNRNITDNYPLPFTPPARWTNSIEYATNTNKSLKHWSVKLSHQQIFAQHHISRNEEATPATGLWNISLHSHWQWGNLHPIIDLQVLNIFDTAYLNHLSFYRKLNAPEPGRNIQLIIKLPI